MVWIVPRFTLGILLVVWHQCVQNLLVDSSFYLHIGALIATCFSVFTGIKVILTSLSLDQLIVLGQFETLCQRLVGLEFHTR